jgi:hypothetical protein
MLQGCKVIFFVVLKGEFYKMNKIKIVNETKYKYAIARKIKAIFTFLLILFVAIGWYKLPLIFLCVAFYKIDNDLADLEVFTGYDEEVWKKQGIKIENEKD